MSMTKIATVTVGSGGAASIDFTSIAGTFTDLMVVASLRASVDANSSGAILSVKPNGSTSSITARTLNGTGSSADSGTETIWYGRTNPSDYTSSTFSNVSIYIPNYAGSTNKSVSIDGVAENNATATKMVLSAGLWSNTTAISSLNLVPGGGSWVQYSTATLYGITKGSLAGVTVS